MRPSLLPSLHSASSLLELQHARSLDSAFHCVGLAPEYSVEATSVRVWMVTGYFDTIPLRIEAPTIIGSASPPTILFRVILPLAKPVVAVTIQLSLTAGWHEFILATRLLEEEAKHGPPRVIPGRVQDAGHARRRKMRTEDRSP